jgi:uncharacterized protein (TIGR00290 family)
VIPVQREPVLLSWSGGKDSALALATLAQSDRVRVVGLLTSITRDYDRVSIHGVRRALLDEQARALGLPLHAVELDAMCSNEAYAEAFLTTVSALVADDPDLSRIAFGDLFLEDVRAYRESLLARIGMTGVFPIWGEPTREAAERCLALGIEARLVCVDTTQLPAGFVGRLFDRSLLAELPEGVDPCGERGEFHTFVSNAPGFARPVEYEVGELVLRDQRFAYRDLLPVSASRDPIARIA